MKKASRTCVTVARITQRDSSFMTSLAASMTMAARNFGTVVTHARLCLSFLSLVGATWSACPGPTQYYEDVGCMPVFNSPDSICPEKYNCDHLKTLPADKCVVNGHEYAIGEQLKEEDANPCDIGCSCAQGTRGPDFTCAIVDCFFGPEKPGCYRQSSSSDCCPGPEVCPEVPEDRATCLVDGKEYKDGEYFTIPAEPMKNCVCQPGYKGENVEPFCVLPKHSYCGMFRRMGDIREGCVPVYYSSQNPNSSCSVFSRCRMLCNFGNLTMRVGDELNQATDYNSVCVKCLCEVPPIPTCQRLPDNECDITKHPPFNSR